MKTTKKKLLSVLAHLSFAFCATLVSNTSLAQSQDSERKASRNNQTTQQRATSASDSSADRRSSKKSRSRRRSSTTSSTSTTSDYTKEDCATKYMLGLDRECYNTNTISEGGVYADCSDRTMADFYDIMDMQLSAVVGVDKFATYKKNCDAYKSYALTKWLESKKTIETSAIKGSLECTTAQKKLTAAKKCYAAAIAHDGNFFEFSELMKTTCGEQLDVATKFAKAGDMGLSNIPEMLENYSTLQFTNKSENWRQAVEAILAGYIYDARQQCGEESYDILELNQFTADKRENIIKTARTNFAAAAGANLGRRASNSIIHSTSAITPRKQPNMATTTTIAGSIANGLSVGIASTVATINNHRNIRSASANDAIRYGITTPQLHNNLAIGNIYVIEGVSNINNTRARLVNILNTNDVGTIDTQDSIDIAIVRALGGRVGTTDNGLYDILNNLIEGDTFVIRQSDLKSCQILMIDINGNLTPLTNTEIMQNQYLPNYVSDCARILE